MGGDNSRNGGGRFDGVTGGIQNNWWGTEYRVTGGVQSNWWGIG